MRKLLITALVFLFSFTGFSQQLNLEQGNRLASLPLKCLQQEYPNKLGQLLLDSTEILSPKALHPSFYGCFDWHSSVHGHWSLVYLLKQFPDLNNRPEIIQKLKINLSKTNVEKEVLYLNKKHEKSFERLYGWAWVLKLQQELSDCKEPFAQELSQNLQPLSDLLIEMYAEFLPKLYYPVRVGTHNNTAFGMTLAWDYAVYSKNEKFKKILKDNALRMFQKDEGCPFTWEPSGTDFLSPCMEEMGIMQRILTEEEFLKWAKKFAKPLFAKKFKWETAKVSDRTDGHLVHLDGLNFSRAWHFYALAAQFEEFRHLKTVGDLHMEQSLPFLTDGNYEGEHWLASFALRAFEERKRLQE
ncbi:MAG TPA: DUF2891 domain-containing protein [Flavobacterium sp.]|uniref:DUF2891 domain-containing protein n=1 Tax=Flavobacterium sp. TaxID=239 RepID=UPI002C4264D8|nr:DUF2891 domain-containing protein [Flavobacterium sp.]HSD14424.1 DUF2891 domain-containing protein [Flavobacterium sp.]